MNKNNHSYILISEDSKMFTSLNRYDRGKKHFEGEYSILHNAYTYDSFFLSKFLLDHEGKPLMLLPNTHENYYNVSTQYDRFLQEDIPLYLEEKTQKENEQLHDRKIDRNLGQLQLAIVKKMMEEQLKTVRTQDGKTPADHQVLLGKELSLQWAIHMIEDVVRKGQ